MGKTNTWYCFHPEHLREYKKIYNRNKRKCLICEKEMKVSSIYRHMKNVHNCLMSEFLIQESKAESS